jgi:hypothetical protein
MPPDFTPDVKDLISKMLVLDPHKRIKVGLFPFFRFPLLSCLSPEPTMNCKIRKGKID